MFQFPGFAFNPYVFRIKYLLKPGNRRPNGAVRQSVWESEEMIEITGDWGNYREAVDASREYWGNFYTVHPNMVAMTDPWVVAVQETILGEKTAQEVADCVAVKAALEDGIVARKQKLNKNQVASVSECNLLSLKPVLYVANIESVDDLARDLERYRQGRPIEARPSTFGYRARKFVRRHRVAVAGAVVVAATAVAGLAGVLWQAREARLHAERAEAVGSFLFSLFESADPEANPGEPLTVLDHIFR